MFDIDSMPEFRSGNSVPVTRATISRERMREVMEAYADARVREALEEAEAKLMEMHEHAFKSRVPPDEDEDGWNAGCVDRAIALGEAVLAIRSLIPTDPRPGQP